MVALSWLLLAVVSSLALSAEAATIGQVLENINSTMQHTVTVTHKSVDKLLTVGNGTVNTVADLVASGTNKLSTWGINKMDAGGTLSKQGIDTMQDAINGMMNVANRMPIAGKVVSGPNGVISKIVNSSLEFGRDSVDAAVGAGEASAAIGNAVTGYVTGTVASASSAVTSKVSSAANKGFGLVSEGISRGIESTAGTIQKLGGLINWVGNKVAQSATLPDSTLTASSS